ncbi:MAG: glycoside hydrolase [Thermoplasmata archaeon]|nr:glycoside hydrolase [Thermoplasmata archaeon]
MNRLMVIASVLVALLVLSGGVYYAFYTGDSDDDEKAPVFVPGPFDFNWTIPNTTYYHFAGALDAREWYENLSANLTGDNAPFWANGTYYGIGTHTFEPTIGVTSTGTLFMSSHNGLGEGTHVIRSKDQGQTWEDVTPNPNIVRNSNDPYIYVDPWTDRVVKFDMHALLGMTMEYSDDEGDTWETLMTRPVSGLYTPQDHQTIASMPPPPGFPMTLYDTVYVYSINTGLQGGGVGGSYGSTSIDGGSTWDVEKPHYQIGQSPASGLSGHLVGANDGKIYRGQPAGDYQPAMYRSTNGGMWWTEHIITTETGTQTHEIAIGVDEANNVHAFWIGADNMPYYSNSLDFGDTWCDPMMVAPPGVGECGFPSIAGGADGRCAFTYIGLNEEGTGWSGYLGVITDAWNEHPLITTVAVNQPEDPLDTSDDCGFRRCGGFGDFIDICIDPDGRPWAALANNRYEDAGIVGIYTHGPALRGDIGSLPVLPVGGPSTI